MKRNFKTATSPTCTPEFQAYLKEVLQGCQDRAIERQQTEDREVMNHASKEKASS